jgi:hypothetical protein
LGEDVPHRIILDNIFFHLLKQIPRPLVLIFPSHWYGSFLSQQAGHEKLGLDNAGQADGRKINIAENPDLLCSHHISNLNITFSYLVVNVIHVDQ